MTVIGMIKLFAWESHVGKRIDEKRQVELKALRLSKFLQLLNANVKCVLTSDIFLVIN